MVDNEAKPPDPNGEAVVWYRGWEAGYEWQREYYTGEGLTAYRGGCDLEARYVSAATWSGLLALVDDEMEGEVTEPVTK
ncbi:MAG: hypothetical protein V4657_12360 [Pseudomonadota bacterium]